MSLTAHFVENDFTFNSCLLGLKNVADSHTSKCLANNIDELITHWDTKKKVKYVIA